MGNLFCLYNALGLQLDENGRKPIDAVHV